ncbi:IS5 family transposase [Actinoplanes sp. NPDC049668]|uniref:IS5 family transposase n=1 Tax=unclassified Actinoplanes TaxID=2626549 RepID=UPI0033A1629D
MCRDRRVGHPGRSQRAPTHRPTPALPLRHSDAEWAVLAPHVPAGTGRGRPIIYPRRDIVDAIRYLDRTGCQWDALPADFPHPKLVYHYFKAWTCDGTLNRMHNHLRERVEGRDRHPPPPSWTPNRSAARNRRPLLPRLRRRQEVNGRKRHITVDTCGLLLAILVTGAGVQDRDGARSLLWAVHACFPGIRLVWADSGYTGQLVGWACTARKQGFGV